MRAIELAKVAAAAEALRLRRLARRQAIRAGLGAGAAVFAVAALVLVHVVIYDILFELVHRAWLAALILLVIDLVVAGLFGSMALSSRPDRIEQEAMVVRRQSLAEARRAVTFMTVAGELTGLALRRGSARAVNRSSIGRLWTIADVASRFVRRR